MSIIALSTMPKPKTVEELDFEVILQRRKERLIEITSPEKRESLKATLALASEPMVKQLEENAYRELLLRADINRAAVAGMLAWAEDEDLDNLAANYGVERLVIVPEDLTAVPPVPAVMESDESLRERCLLSWDALSTAGPRGAYEYFARLASGKVLDARASSPSPACALIAILSNDGDGTADKTLCDLVYVTCSEEDRRPLGDRLTVQSARILPYRIDAVLYTELVGAEAQVMLTMATERLAKWINPRRRIGVEIAQSAIDAQLHVPGINKVELLNWADITPNKNTEAAYCTGYTVRLANQ